MIRKIILILFLVILNLQQSFAVKDWRRTQLDAIENKFNTCIENSKTTKEKTSCHTNAIDKYNIEIGNIIKDIKTLISQSQYETLIKSEEQWKDYYNKYVLFLNNSIKKTDKNIMFIESIKHYVIFKHVDLLDFELFELVSNKYCGN